MTKLEILTKEVLDNLSRNMDEESAQNFLHRNFSDLSEREVLALTQPIRTEKEPVVEKIIDDLQRELEDLKARDLESFVQDKFSFMEIEEQRELMMVFCRPIPPRYPRRAEARLRIEQLIDQVLDNLPQVMEEDEAHEYLQSKFPSLTGDDVQQLAQPVVFIRQRAVEKVVMQLGKDARKQRVMDLPKMLTKRFVYLEPEDVERIVPEIVRPIPPRRRPRPKPGPKPPKKPRKNEP